MGSAVNPWTQDTTLNRSYSFLHLQPGKDSFRFLRVHVNKANNHMDTRFAESPFLRQNSFQSLRNARIGRCLVNPTFSDYETDVMLVLL